MDNTDFNPYNGNPDDLDEMESWYEHSEKTLGAAINQIKAVHTSTEDNHLT